MATLIGIKGLPSPPVITLASRCALGGVLNRFGVGAAASGASPWSGGADLVLCFPFVIEQQTTFYKVFWVNGTAAGGNSDVGIYDASYSFIVGTGAATAGSGNSVPQSVALTATTTLPPGQYYAGMTHSATTTGQLFRWSVASLGMELFGAYGCFMHNSDAGPLNVTPLVPATLVNVAFPVFGLITRSVFDV